MAEHEQQGTGFDSGAAGHELAGRHTAGDELRAALAKLIDDYVETDSDAADAVAALTDRIDAVERWRDKRGGG